jgi:Arc/MetJ-type ribon-helix-helix transcriptional regulator
MIKKRNRPEGAPRSVTKKVTATKRAKRTLKTVKPRSKKPRGNPNGPPVRGRRNRSTIDQQVGFADWLETQLLEVPKPTYEDIEQRLKATGFYASRSALSRWGLKFDVRRREMKILLEKARILASEDPETILVLEKATSNLAETKLFEFLLGHDKDSLDENALSVIFAHSRLQSSSASRERAATVAGGKFRAAMTALKRSLDEKLRSKPEIAKIVVELIDKSYAEVSR